MARSGTRATVGPVNLDDGGTRQPCPQEASCRLRDRDQQAKGFDSPATQHSRASHRWGGGAQLCPKHLILVRRKGGKIGGQQKGKTKQKGEEKWRARKKKIHHRWEGFKRHHSMSQETLTLLAYIFQICFLKIPMKSQMTYKWEKNRSLNPPPKGIKRGVKSLLHHSPYQPSNMAELWGESNIHDWRCNEKSPGRNTRSPHPCTADIYFNKAVCDLLPLILILNIFNIF